MLSPLSRTSDNSHRSQALAAALPAPRVRQAHQEAVQRVQAELPALEVRLVQRDRLERQEQAPRVLLDREDQQGDQRDQPEPLAQPAQLDRPPLPGQLALRGSAQQGPLVQPGRLLPRDQRVRLAVSETQEAPERQDLSARQAALRS